MSASVITGGDLSGGSGCKTGTGPGSRSLSFAVSSRLWISSIDALNPTRRLRGASSVPV